MSCCFVLFRGSSGRRGELGIKKALAVLAIVNVTQKIKIMVKKICNDKLLELGKVRQEALPPYKAV